MAWLVRLRAAPKGHALAPLLLSLALLASGEVPPRLHSCAPSATCTVELEGSASLGPDAQLQAVARDSACGEARAADFPGRHPVTSSQVSGGGTIRFDFGTLGATPGIWRLCACAVGCEHESNFSTYAGGILVRGVTSMEIAAGDCIVGKPQCTVRLHGLGQSSGDLVGLVEAESKCNATATYNYTVYDVQQTSPSETSEPHNATNATNATQVSHATAASNYPEDALDFSGNAHQTAATVEVLPDAGVYRLCYRSALFQTSTMSAGLLEVGGPTEVRTMSGDMALPPVVGHPFTLHVHAAFGGLATSDRIGLVGGKYGCGPHGIAAHALVGGNLSMPDEGTNSTLVWMGVVLHEAGRYAVWWCGGGWGSNCTTDSDFGVLAGSFLVHGPVGLSTTSVQPAVGELFAVTVAGIGLSGSDQLRIGTADACGGPGSALHAPQLRGPLAKTPAMPGEGNTTSRLWGGLWFAATGSFPVCWCSGIVSAGCTADRDFGLLLGFVDVWGPILEQHRCSMDRSCLLSLLGVPPILGSSSRVALVPDPASTCEHHIGDLLEIEGLINPQVTQLVEVGLYTRFRFRPLQVRSGQTLQLAEIVLHNQGQRLSLDGVEVTGLLGSKSPAGETAEFAVDGHAVTKFLDFGGMGLELRMPSPTQVDGLSFVTANDFPERDPVAFIFEGSFDGQTWSLLAFTDDLDVPMDRFTETTVVPCGLPAAEALNETHYALGVMTGNHVGNYSICWTHGGSNDVWVPSGSMLLAGPHVPQDQLCTVGEPCNLGPVVGVGLSERDKVVVISREAICGQTLNRRGTGSTTLEEPAGPWPATAVASGSVAVSVPQDLLLHGSRWGLCYCTHGEDACVSDQDFVTKLGTWVISGPASSSQDFSCHLFSASCTVGPVMGEGLSVSDAVMLVMEGKSCVPTLVNSSNVSTTADPAEETSSRGSHDGITQNGSHPLDDLVLQASLDPRGKPVFVVPNASQSTALPGQWLVCYCVGAAAGRCGDPSGFTAAVGSLTVVGPLTLVGSSCVLGAACSVVVDGYGLGHTNALMLVEGNRSCGTSPTDIFEGLHSPQRPQLQGGSTAYHFGAPVAGPVGEAVLRLCWAHAWATWADFGLDVGVLEVTGPALGIHRLCVLGIPCVLEVPGLSIGPESELWLIGGHWPLEASWKLPSPPSPCATAGVDEAAKIEGMADPRVPTNTTASEATYDFGTALVGDVGAPYRICWRSSPGTPFNVEVGVFELHGPRLTEHVCTKGYPCNLTLAGVGLAASDRLFLAPDAGCNASGEAAAEGASFEGLAGPISPRAGEPHAYDLGTTLVGRPGLELQLCWLGRRGEGVESSAVHAGSFHLAGPVDGQALTCSPGRPCVPALRGRGSGLWDEFWMVTGSEQPLPNHSVYTDLRCLIISKPRDRQPQQTWRLVPADGRGSFWIISGDLQACLGKPLHLSAGSCLPVTAERDLEPSLAWTLVPDGASGRHWIVSSREGPCPGKMLVLETGGLRAGDFWRWPAALWELVPRDATPWPHRSSLLLVPEGDSCGGREAPSSMQLHGLKNPAACCRRVGPVQALDLAINLGTQDRTAPGVFRICWGFSSQDGPQGGTRMPPTAEEHPVSAGTLALLGPDVLGEVSCSMGVPCHVLLPGAGLSLLDSITLKEGEECTWPPMPPFDSSTECAPSGSDFYVLNTLIDGERNIISTACPGQYTGEGIPLLLLRTYYMPISPRLFPAGASVPLPGGPVGVALDGLAIFGGAPPGDGAAPPGGAEADECGVEVNSQGEAHYSSTPGMGRPGVMCPHVASWASLLSREINISSDDVHPPILGFMMDGVPLFASLAESAGIIDATLDSCGGHDSDLPFYHYHANGSRPGEPVIPCLRGATTGGGGFAILPAPLRGGHGIDPLDDLSWLMPYQARGNREALIRFARTARRFLPTALTANGTTAHFELGRSPFTGGRYAICWGRGVRPDAHRIYIGSLQLVGPEPSSFACTLGLACDLRLEGEGLSGSNRLMLVQGQDCREDAAADIEGLSPMPLAPDNSSAGVYHLGTLVAGRVGAGRTVCWLADTGDADADMVPAGPFELHGPENPCQRFVCSPARNCSVPLAEYKATMPAPADLMASLGTGCGNGTAPLAAARGPDEQYNFGLLAPDTEPGTYLLCWAPQQAGASLVLTGTLMIRGPGHLSTRTPTVAGQAFDLELSGHGLRGSELRIVPASVVCGSSESDAHTPLLRGPLLDNGMLYGEASIATSTNSANFTNTTAPDLQAPLLQDPLLDNGTLPAEVMFANSANFTNSTVEDLHVPLPQGLLLENGSLLTEESVANSANSANITDITNITNITAADLLAQAPQGPVLDNSTLHTEESVANSAHSANSANLSNFTNTTVADLHGPLSQGSLLDNGTLPTEGSFANSANSSNFTNTTAAEPHAHLPSLLDNGALPTEESFANSANSANFTNFTNTTAADFHAQQPQGSFLDNETLPTEGSFANSDNSDNSANLTNTTATDFHAALLQDPLLDNGTTRTEGSSSNSANSANFTNNTSASGGIGMGNGTDIVALCRLILAGATDTVSLFDSAAVRAYFESISAPDGYADLNGSANEADNHSIVSVSYMCSIIASAAAGTSGQSILADDASNASNASSNASEPLSGECPRDVDAGLPAGSLLEFGENSFLLGGEFRVCFCPGGLADACQGPASFSTEAGYLQVRGPAGVRALRPASAGFEMSLEATAGAPFTLRLPGVALSAGDRVRILDAVTIAQEPRALDVQACSPEDVALLAVPLAALDDVPPAVEGGGEAEEWANVTIDRAGVFDVCWCPAGSDGSACNTSFGVHAGQFRVLGPNRVAADSQVEAPLGPFAGISTGLQVLGDGLSRGDLLKVVAATARGCREALDPALAGGALAAGPSAADGGPGLTGDAGTSQRWALELLVPQRCRACWCPAAPGEASGPALCGPEAEPAADGLEHSWVDLGEFDVLGPHEAVTLPPLPGEYGAAAAVVAGLPFALELTGQRGLAEGVAVLATLMPAELGCTQLQAESSRAQAMPPGEPSGEVDTSGGHFLTRRWPPLQVYIPGDLRLCIQLDACAAHANLASRCGTGHAAGLGRPYDIGGLSALGPSQLLPKQLSEWPAAGSEFVLGLTGQGLTAGDELYILDAGEACGGEVQVPVAHAVPTEMGALDNSSADAAAGAPTPMPETLQLGNETGNTTGNASDPGAPVLAPETPQPDDGIGNGTADAAAPGGPVPGPAMPQTGNGTGNGTAGGGNGTDNGTGNGTGNVADSSGAGSNASSGAGSGDATEGGTSSGLDTSAGFWKAAVNWTVPALPLAGKYRVCWCSGLSGCNGSSDFNVDAGEFQAAGPTGGVATICARAGPCDVELLGPGVAQNGSASATLRRNEDCQGSVDAPLPDESSGTGDRLALRWDSLDVLVGTYFVCWTAAANGTGRSVSAGSVHVVGPYNGQGRRLAAPGTGHGSTWRCVSGRRCAVVGLEGEGLQAGDGLAARETACGTYDDDAGEGRRFEGSSDAETLVIRRFHQPATARRLRIYPTRWHGHVALRAGLLVRACPGCQASTAVDLADSLRSASSVNYSDAPADCFDCGRLSSSSAWVAQTAALGEWYEMDAGEVTQIHGVALRGRADAEQWVEEFVVSLSTDGQTWTRLREVRSAAGFPNGGEAFARMSNGTQFFVWPGPIAARGGVYQLCWRRADAPLTALADFKTAVGLLWVDGPVGGQTWYCNVGRPCRVTGLEGYGLGRGDYLRPLPHCGMMDASAPIASASDDNGTDFDWGSSSAHLPPRRYRLCWCRPWKEANASVPGTCDAGNVFADAGMLIIVGPRVGSFRCYVGQTCTITPLEGENLLDGDRLLISQAGASCGSPAALAPVPGVPDGGVSEPADVRGSRYQWLSAPITASGGDYGLCWCSIRLSDCRQHSSYTIQAGTLTLAGPNRDQTRTCIGGLGCMLEDITGVDLKVGDEIEVRDSCILTRDADGNYSGGVTSVGFPGPAKLVPGGPNNFEWEMPVTASGGLYRLCWRPSGSQGGYGADVGPLIVLGPLPGHLRQAAASLRLSVAAFSGGLGDNASESTASRMADRVMVLNSCSGQESLSVVPGIPTSGISQKLALGASEFFWGSSFISASGGEYRLCWCAGHKADGSPRTCRSSLDFVVDAGVLTLAGPRGGQTWTCAASRSCAVSGLRGFGLSTSDRLLIKVGNCNSGEPLRGLHWASMPAEVEEDGAMASFHWGNSTVGAVGGYYRVCYCTERSWAADHLPCTSSNTHRFSTDAGMLIIKGPRPVHGPWAVQFGGAADEVATTVTVDSAEPEKGLGHAVLAGWTRGVIDNAELVRMQAEDAGLRWSEGRDPSDYVTVKCGWTRHDAGDDQFSGECTYPRLALQPLDLKSFGGTDGWVAKIAYNGSRLWTRQVGTPGEDAVYGVAVSLTDHTIAIGGSTNRGILPGAPYDPGLGHSVSYSGGTDCFVIKLDQFGEYLGAFQFGSSEDDRVVSVAVGRDGGIYCAVVCGETMLNRPTEGGLDSMIVKFSADLTYLWAGLVGSLGDDILASMVLYQGSDGQDHIFAAGTTTVPFLKPVLQGGTDVIAVVYSCGDVDNRERGRQYGSDEDDEVSAVAVGSDGSFYVAGHTKGNIYLDWVPADEPDEKPGPGTWDGYVMKLDSQLEWKWSAMIGTKHQEYVWGLAFLPGADPAVDGDLLLSGSTYTFWPDPEAEAAPGTPSSTDGSLGSLGHEDAFLMSITPDGRHGGWEKQLRSQGDERLLAVAGEASGGHAYIVGQARGSAQSQGGGGFTPEIGATELTAYGGEDALILKIAWGRANAWCFRGSSCQAGLPSGIGLGDFDQAIISGTRCGLGAVNAPGIPNSAGDGAPIPDPPGVADEASRGLRQRFQWGDKSTNKVLTAEVGLYTLCWCAEGCEGAVPLEVAVIFIAGPVGDQERTCVTGEPCDLTGILGRDISSWDRLAIMSTCTRDFAQSFPGGAITEGMVRFKAQSGDASCRSIAAEEMAGVTSNFRCERVNADAGTYRMCFCTPRSGDGGCEGAGEYTFDVGRLTMAGPYRGQRRKCIQNQRCLLTGIAGVALEDGDLILALDRCRLPRVDSAAGPSMLLRGVPGLTASAAAVASDGGSSFFVIDPVASASGSYKMCWCRPSASFRACTRTDDFTAEAGDLVIVAPAANHLRRCSRGQQCSILDLEGFGLEQGDLVRVMSRCPTAPNPLIAREDIPALTDDFFVPGWPNDGLSLPAEGGGRKISWGVAPVWAAAGRYALCWCMASIGGCDRPIDFFVRLGDLVLAGPLPGQHFSAVVGRPMVVSNLLGYGLSEGDGLAILSHEDNCTPSADNAAIVAAAEDSNFPENGILSPVLPPFVPANGEPKWNVSVHFSSEASPVVRDGGSVALCKPSAGTPAGSAFDGYVFLGCGTEAEARSTCSPRLLPMPKTEEEQRVLHGAVRKARAAGLQLGPCGTSIWLGGQWSTINERWEWDDTTTLSDGLVPTFGDDEQLPSWHAYMNWAGGQPSAYPAQHSEPWIYMNASSGEWLDAHTGRYTFGIVCEEAVPLPVGSLSLHGPYSSHNFESPVMRTLAIVGLQGVELRAEDVLLVAEAGSACGDGRAAAALGGTGFSFRSVDGKNFSWPGVSQAPGGFYTLCWCRPDPGSIDCYHAEQFLMDVGTLTLVGPLLQQEHQCHSGENCTVTIRWPDGVPPVLSHMLVAMTERCDGSVDVGFTGGPANGTEQFEWPRLRASGGRRALCWCVPPGCHSPESFWHQVGMLEVVGPHAGQHFECMAGRPCDVAPLRGLGLQDGPRLTYTNGTACDGPAAREVSLPAKRCKTYISGCTYSWTAEQMSIPNGVYLLCWCARPNCTAVDFIVDVGTLDIVTATPL